MAVIMRHFQGDTFEKFPWFQNIGGQGYLAVGLFFVLSGFVLSYNYLTPERVMRGTRQEFWVARFARIYPAYLAAFLLSLPLFTAAISKSHGGGGTAVRLTLGGTLVLLLIQSWTPWTANYVNSPAWSLSTESFFYFAFPFCLPYVARLGCRGCLGSLVLLWVGALAAPALYCALLGNWPFGSFVVHNVLMEHVLQCFPPLRLPEFLMGMVLGRYFHLKRTTLPTRGSARPLVAASFLLIALSFSWRVPEVLAGSGLMAPLFLFLIWTLATSDGLFVRFLSSRLLVWLGEISYGIYILQEPVIRWLERLSGRSIEAEFFPYSLVLILTAGLCYHFVEAPMRNWIKTRLVNRVK